MINNSLMNKLYAFVLHINVPMKTVSFLALLLEEKQVHVDHLKLHRFHNGEALLIVQCELLEKEVHELSVELDQLPEVLKWEKLTLDKLIK